MTDADAARDAFCEAVEATAGPALPDPTQRKLFIGDAFMLVLPDGTKELHVWSGTAWVKWQWARGAT